MVMAAEGLRPGTGGRNGQNRADGGDSWEGGRFGAVGEDRGIGVYVASSL